MKSIDTLKEHLLKAELSRILIRTADHNSPDAVNAAHRQLERAEDAVMGAAPHLLAVVEAAKEVNVRINTVTLPVSLQSRVRTPEEQWEYVREALNGLRTALTQLESAQ